MLDYRVRVHHRFPDKTMQQVVIYLQPTQSDLVQQTAFALEKTRHEFEVIRLWEQPVDDFLTVPGLLPFATLSQTNDQETVLRQVAEQIEAIPVDSVQSSVAASLVD